LILIVITLTEAEGQFLKMKELKTIFKDPTEKTPQIDFNRITGELILSGRSIPENATETYEPVYNWVTNYILDPRQTTNLRLNLEYFNTASCIWFAKIVRCLSKIEIPDSVLLVHLYYNVEEFDSMNVEDVKTALSNVVDDVNPSTISVGIKLHATDETGKAIKESMVLI
jgi:hypothetical protein